MQVTGARESIYFDGAIAMNIRITRIFHRNFAFIARKSITTIDYGITGKSMCLSIYLSKSEQEVFDI